MFFRILSKFKKIKIDTDNSKFSLSLFFLFIILFFIKLVVIYISYVNISPFKYCLAHFISDYYYLLIILFLVTISLYSKNKIIKYGSNIINLLLIIIYCFDIFSIYYFQTRESLLGLFNLVNGVGGGFGFSNLIILYIIMFIIGVIAINYIINKYFTSFKKFLYKIFSPQCFLLYFLLGVLLYTIQPIVIKNRIPQVQNILFINIETIKKIQTSKMPIFTDKKYEDYVKYEPGDNKNLNVVLVFLESFSAIDSARLGGNNNTPHLDKIQENGITFTNFFSNGIHSHHAHVGVLLGIPPIKEDYNYPFIYLNSNGLANFLNKQGYYTTFISSAYLSFIDQRIFLSGVGFQKIIGEEEFEDKKTYTFDSAPDKDLYDRALQEIKVQTGKYFIGLQTISFHEPYDTPLGKTEKLALQYSDQELYKFYQGLEDLRFFDNGILIIIGDHRKRTPAEKGEYSIFGPMRKGKSIVTIVGSGIESGSFNNNFIQHTDFYYFIKKLLGDENVEMNVFYNDLLSPIKNRDWGMLDNGSTLGPTDDTEIFSWNGENYYIDYNHNNKEAYDYYLFLKSFLLKNEILSDKLEGL